MKSYKSPAVLSPFWDKDNELYEHEVLSPVLHRYYDNALEYLRYKGQEINREGQHKQRLYSLVAA